MIRLKDIVDKICGVSSSKRLSSILIELNEITLKRYCPESLLTEGQWRDAKIGDYSYRVDPANPTIPQLRHVHVAHHEHIHTKSKQVSWNEEGSRHDRRTFDTNFHGIEKAKQIARSALGLPRDFKLEHVTYPSDRILLLEDTSSIPQDAIVLKG